MTSNTRQDSSVVSMIKLVSWVCVCVFPGVGPAENVPSVYGLDVTDVSRWERTVLSPALQVLERLSKVRLLQPRLLLRAQVMELFLVIFVSLPMVQGEEPPVSPLRAQEPEQRNKRSRHTCDLCDKLVIGDLEWTGEALDVRRDIKVPEFC